MHFRTLERAELTSYGLHYANVSALASIGDIEQINIGHAIAARAIFIGLEKAVREIKSALMQGVAGSVAR